MSKLRGRRVKAENSSSAPGKCNNKEASRALLVSSRSQSDSLTPLGRQQLFGLLVVVVERRQSSESQRGRDGGEDREGPSQAAPDRLQESGKDLRRAGRSGRVKPGTAEEKAEDRNSRQEAASTGTQHCRDAAHLSDRLLESRWEEETKAEEGGRVKDMSAAFTQHTQLLQSD